MNKLEFSTNWNKKLNCKCFTTIRLHNPQKYFIGEVFAIMLNEKNVGFAKLKDLKQIKIDEINNFMSFLDTGYNAATTKEIIKNIYKSKQINFETQVFDYCVFEYQDPQTEMRFL